MPMIELRCTREVPQELLKELSSIVALAIGKPEKYVMVCAGRADMLMSGSEGPAAFAEVRSIGGLDRVVNHEISMKVCNLLRDRLGIPADRISEVALEISPTMFR